MLPSVDSLHCFSEAARLLNFRAAARAVSLTPAALGQRIRQLEEQLGVQLFHRTTRNVVLTEHGLALLPYAHKTLAAAAECTRAARGEIGPAPVELLLGTRYELGMSWIVPMLPTIRAAQPSVTLHLYFGSSADLMIRVRTLEIDCAVGSMRVADPKLDSFKLHPEHYVFVGKPALLARKPLRRHADAARHTLVDTRADLALFRYFADAPGGEKLDFQRFLFMGAIGAVRELALRGEGVAVLPQYLVAPDLAAHRLVRLFPKVQLLSDHFRIIFRADDPRRSVYEALAATMRGQPLR